MDPHAIRQFRLARTLGLWLSLFPLIAPAGASGQDATASAAADDNVLVVAWNSRERVLFRVNRERLQAQTIAKQGLQRDGTRAWSVINIINGREGRMQPAHYANGAEYRALGGKFWRFTSPDGRHALIGHGFEGGNAAIQSVDLIDVATGSIVSTINFGRKRFVRDMLWMPDSKTVVLLDINAHVTNLKEAATVLAGHGIWKSDVYVHFVDADTGKSSRVVVAKMLRQQSIALALPFEVVY